MTKGESVVWSLRKTWVKFFCDVSGRYLWVRHFPLLSSNEFMAVGFSHCDWRVPGHHTKSQRTFCTDPFLRKHLRTSWLVLLLVPKCHGGISSATAWFAICLEPERPSLNNSLMPENFGWQWRHYMNVPSIFSWQLSVVGTSCL
jgi:hypothetical protein